ITLAREMDHSFSLVMATLGSLQVQHHVHDHTTALAQAEALIALCEKHRIPQWIGMGHVLSGVARVAQGSTELGLRLIEDGLKANRTVGVAIFNLMLLALSAGAHVQVGNNARALELLSEAIEISEKGGVGWYRQEVLRLQAEVLLQSKQITID